MMYLTPPHSRSDGLHSDVMDAWKMVQLESSKTWKIDGWHLRYPLIRLKLNGSCEVVMQQGQKLVQTSLYSPPCLFDPIAIPSYSPDLISISLCEHF